MSLQLDLRLQRKGWQLSATTHFTPGINVILGPSGAGKSTLLRAIAGLQQAQGSIEFEGRALQALPVHQRHIGYVRQKAALLPHLSIEKNLAFARQRGIRPYSAQELSALLEQLELTSLLARRPRQLSGGQAQRAALACALVGGARLLLLDEPGADLDHAAHEAFLAYLRALVSEHQLTALLVTHQLWEAARCADQAAMMQSGQLSALRPINAWLTDAELACRRDACAALDLELLQHDARDHLLSLKCGEQVLQVPGHMDASQTRRRILIPATAVSLLREEQSHGSALNHLKVTVREIYPAGPGEQVLRLSCEGGDLLARVTSRSQREMGLAVGCQAIAQIKATALH